MVVVNIFDPIVIIVVIYTVLMTLIGLFNTPYPSSFLLLITLAVVTSYIYYKVDKNEPILTPTCETEMPFTTMPSTTMPSTTMPPTTMPSTTMPSTTMPSTTMPSTTMPSTTMPPGSITTLPVI